MMIAGHQFAHVMLLFVQSLCGWDSSGDYSLLIRSAMYISSSQL